MSDSFHTFQAKCGALTEQLKIAKLTEHGLNQWKTDLFDAYNTFNDYDLSAKVSGTLSDYRLFADIDERLETCRKVIKEMLRILNPEEKQYQVWFALGDRERFLKDIGFTGFQQGRMPQIVHMQGLLGRLAALG